MDAFIVLGAAGVAAFIFYGIGYRCGYRAGRENELDQVAKRAERAKRFGGSYEE